MNKALFTIIGLALIAWGCVTAYGIVFTPLTPAQELAKKQANLLQESLAELQQQASEASQLKHPDNIRMVLQSVVSNAKRLSQAPTPAKPTMPKPSTTPVPQTLIGLEVSPIAPAKKPNNCMPRWALPKADGGVFPKGIGAKTVATIKRESKRFRVNPALLVAMIHQESGLNPLARSSVGAVGTMQFMPATAKGLHCNPYKHHENIACGAKYMRKLLTAYGNDVSSALAAYNGGDNAVKALRKGKPWAETRGYLAGILPIYKKFQKEGN